MKSTPSVFIILLLLLSSCKTSYFDTPGDFRNIPGTLYLTNGKSFEGNMTINTQNFLGSRVKLYTEGDKRPMQFSLADVKAYQIRNDYYALKEVKGGLNIGKQYIFMKRLTNENSRIHLYESTEKITNNNGPNRPSSTYYETQYYMQLPGDTGDEVWSLGSTKFVPNFDEKMSRLVSDCPTLAAKIANKEPGYFYAQISMFKEKRVNVLMQIIDEYNRCN